MTAILPRRALLGSAAAVAAVAASRPGRAAMQASFTQVAGFDQQVTGVAVAKDGRMFVNFPRWEKDVPISVAEVMRDGSIKAFPDAGWNAWRNIAPLANGTHFVCVQSVTIDPQGFLWVVDPAAPGNEFIQRGGPKLVKIDLARNAVATIYPFGEDVCPQGSYLNDVRVSPDGRFAFITDSGQRGAILVLETATMRIRRLLDGNRETQMEPGVVPHVDGHELRRPDGRKPTFAADGIALDAKGEFLYWQVLVGKTLYRIPTAVLTDPAQSPAQVANAVQKLATTFVADGLWMDQAGYLFLTDPADNAVKMRAPGGGMTIVAQDARLRWPDSMAEGADGSIYVTASHIPEMSIYHEHGSTMQGQYGLFRIAQPHGR